MIRNFLKSLVVAALVAAQVAGPASARPRRVIPVPLLSSVPFWVKQIGGPPILFADPANNRIWRAGYGTQTLTSVLTSTRNSPELALNADGSYTQIGANVPAVGTAGLNSWLASTNSALWSRDLTQAGTWTASNITAAKNATGILGDANAASTLTASAGNGTILQTLSLAAGSTYSVFVKRLTGTGEIDITVNGGTGWANVASLINSTGFTRVSIPNTAITSIGLRIVTNGDAVIVDANQGETVSLATPPILTTNAAVTRAADYNFMSIVVPAAYTLYAEGTAYAPVTYATNQHIIYLSDGTLNNRTGILRGAGSPGGIVFNYTVGGTGQTAPTVTDNILTGVLNKVAYSISGLSQIGAGNGNTGTATATATPTGLNTFGIGQRPDGSQQFNGILGKFGVYPFAASAAQLQAATQ